jgi:hypothetical protein
LAKDLGGDPSLPSKTCNWGYRILAMDFPMFPTKHTEKWLGNFQAIASS